MSSSCARVIAAAVMLLGLPPVSLACNTNDGEAPLFACETARSGYFISICAIETEPGQSWSTAQYRYGTEEKLELVYPPDPGDGPQKLMFSHEDTKHSYTVNIRFWNGGYAYRVYSIAAWEGDEAPAEAMEGDAGVEVRNKAGKLVSAVHCGERPYMFPDYLRRALACDLKNPFGKAGCAENPPRRK